MRAPHQLLIQAAARLAADGHVDLSADIRQLANKWTPESERFLISGTPLLESERFLVSGTKPLDLEQTNEAN